MSDASGEAYYPIKAQYPRLMNGIPWFDIRAGVRFKFWLLYRQPAHATTDFTANILPEYDFNRTFRPFPVTLTEPIGPEEKREEPVPPPAPLSPIHEGLKLPPAIDRSGEAKPKPAPVEPGPTYEGDAQIKGTHGVVGIAFEQPLGKDPNFKARLYSGRFKSLKGDLSGRQVEEDSRSGVAYVLVSSRGITFNLRLDGTILCGTDSSGNRYILRLVEASPRKLTRR
ncbi:hypothetical protein [Singulisphaera sp. PoT]|uniref:hypothetical protein n=1 Tax=Singulisphaera sp. PoT TaxID=3411797 RepID=UPI003BF55632